MIASVKIAPVEHWCEPMKKLAQSLPGLPKIGAEIAIETNSMRTGGDMVLCSGRAWLVVDYPDEALGIDVDTQELCDATGPGENWVCEHVIEID